MSYPGSTVGNMAAWAEIEKETPEFATRARALSEAGTDETIATLRQDGAPRISACDAQSIGGEVTLGMVADSVPPCGKGSQGMQTGATAAGPAHDPPACRTSRRSSVCGSRWSPVCFGPDVARRFVARHRAVPRYWWAHPAR